MTLTSFKRNIDIVLLDLIVFMSFMLVFTSYFFDSNQTKYFLFAIFMLAFIILSLNFIKKFNFDIITYAILFSSFFHSFFFIKDFPLLIIFFSSVIFLTAQARTNLDTFSIKLLGFYTLTLSIQALIWSFFSDSWSFFGSFLVLVFQNPNMTGIVLSNFVILLFVFFLYFEDKILKFIFFALALAMLILTFLTNNRASIFALLVFCLVSFFSNKGKHISKSLSVMLILMPVYFVFVYSLLGGLIPIDQMILNKPFFSGRDLIWNHTINQIIDNPFLLRSYQSGGLNLFLYGIYNFGILAMILFFLFLTNTCNKLKYKLLLPYQKCAYIGFLCIFIQQTFESTLFGGSYGIYVFSYVLLGISMSKKK